MAGHVEALVSRSINSQIKMATAVIVLAVLAGEQPRCLILLWFQRNPLPMAAQRQILARFDA